MITQACLLGISDLIEYHDHVWCALNGHTALLGIRQQTAGELSEIMLVELPEVGEIFQKGDLFGSLQTLSQSIFLDIPVSGRIIEINLQLEIDPDLVKTDPYGLGWLVKVDIGYPYI